MTTILFSVVIPLYNKEKYIVETLESVLNQTYTNYEVIIVDDSSSDNSLSIVRNFLDSRIRVYTKTNGGVSAARNYGITKAEGEIVCFLDADDIWEKNYLENLFNLVQKYPEAGMYCGAYKCFEGNIQNVVKEFNLTKYGYDGTSLVNFFELSYCYGGSIALTSTVSVRKTLLLEVQFNEYVKMGEDVDLWFRLSLLAPVAYNNNPLMLYRTFTTGGLTSTIKSKNGSYPYWNWYELTNDRNPVKFTTLMIYLLAKKCYKNGFKKDSLYCLRRAKGMDYFLKRLILMIKCILY